MTFFTEASIDLVDDVELMDLMVDSSFIAVFIGIESPNEESLRETKKYQNLRRGGTLLEKVHRIQDHGLEVWCGMIMGFDHDDATIFDRQIEFVQKAYIPFSMSSMLYAIPKTPLYKRLLTEDRLDLSDMPECGTNVIPALMTREELRDGFVRVINALYEPRNYFDRTDALFHQPRFEIGLASRDYRTQPLHRIKDEVMFLLQALGLFARLMRNIPEADLRREYRRRIFGLLKRHRRPGLVLLYLFHCAMHYHAHGMARAMATEPTVIVKWY